MSEHYYADESVTLYHGDCREITDWLSADVLVTDPPYGVRRMCNWPNEFRNVPVEDDGDTAARDAALGLWGLGPALVFGSWKQPKPPTTRMVLTWDKGHRGMGDLSLPWFPCTEEVYVLGAGWTGPRTSGVLHHLPRNQHHPTEKPLALLHSLLAKCPPGVVADPFAGSGSTLLAARNQGRRSVGVEIDERYCEIAANRLSQGVLDFGGAA